MSFAFLNGFLTGAAFIIVLVGILYWAAVVIRRDMEKQDMEDRG